MTKLGMDIPDIVIIMIRKARRRAGIRAFMELMVMGWLIRYRRK